MSKVQIGHAPKFFLRVAYHLLKSAIRRCEFAREIRHGNTYCGIVKDGAPTPLGCPTGFLRALAPTNITVDRAYGSLSAGPRDGRIGNGGWELAAILAAGQAFGVYRPALRHQSGMPAILGLRSGGHSQFPEEPARDLVRGISEDRDEPSIGAEDATVSGGQGDGIGHALKKIIEESFPLLKPADPAGQGGQSEQ